VGISIQSIIANTRGIITTFVKVERNNSRDNVPIK